MSSKWFLLFPALLAMSAAFGLFTGQYERAFYAFNLAAWMGIAWNKGHKR